MPQISWNDSLVTLYSVSIPSFQALIHSQPWMMWFVTIHSHHHFLIHEVHGRIHSHCSAHATNKSHQKFSEVQQWLITQEKMKQNLKRSAKHRGLYPQLMLSLQSKKKSKHRPRSHQRWNQTFQSIHKIAIDSQSSPWMLNPIVTAKYPFSCLLQMDTIILTPNTQTYGIMTILTFLYSNHQRHEDHLRRVRLLMQIMASVGMRPAQETVLLELLDIRDENFQVKSINNLLQWCELLCYIELGIDHDMSTSEKTMSFLP